MAIFHCYVSSPEGNSTVLILCRWSHGGASHLQRRCAVSAVVEPSWRIRTESTGVQLFMGHMGHWGDSGLRLTMAIYGLLMLGTSNSGSGDGHWLSVRGQQCGNWWEVLGKPHPQQERFRCRLRAEAPWRNWWSQGMPGSVIWRSTLVFLIKLLELFLVDCQLLR